jgi:aminoglycoside 6'-N-acetyltransferase I
VKIRTIVEDDLPRCAQLYTEIYSATSYGEAWTYENALAWLRELWENCGGSCFVAEERGRVVGFAFCSFHTWWSGTVMRVDELGVDPRLQRHGIGTAIMEHCIAAGRYLRSIAAVEAVSPRTPPGIDFYSSCGFQSEGRELLSRRL